MGIKLRDAFASKVTAAALAAGALLSASAFAQNESPQGADKKPVTAGAIVKSTPSFSNITLAPVIPVPVIFSLGAVFMLAAGMGFARRVPGTYLRTGASTVLLGALINPVYNNEHRETLPTDVIIVVDQSPSQGLGQRKQDAERAYTELEKKLSAQPGLIIHKVDAGASKPGALVDGTNLFSALSEEMNKVPHDRLGAVYFITDGQIHDVPLNHKSLAGIPVHGLITGKANEFDRRVVIDKAAQYGIVNEEQIITFHVADDGAPAGSAAQVRVKINIDGKESVAKTVTAGQKTDVKIKIPHAGINVIEIKTDPVAGELSALNNNAATEIRAKAKELNVLVVSGAPNSGLRMWRELFKSDPDNTVIHFASLRNLTSEDETPSEQLATTPMPMSDIFVNNIKSYDVIVFDHFNNVNILPPPYFENIAAYVKGGGSLLVINGPEYAGETSVFQSEIKDVLPVAPDGTVSQDAFIPKVAGPGAKHPVTRSLPSEMPWGHWYSMSGGQNASGYTVMEGAQRKPLLVLDHKEKGRVAMIMSDQVWLWAAGHDGGGPYKELLTNTSRWLLKNPVMEEEALRLQVSKQDGRLVIEQQTMEDKSSSVTLRSPSGKSLSVNFEAAGPGLWRASLPVDESGLYNANQGGKHPLSTFINVGQANPKEFSSIVSTRDHLIPIAKASGGSVRYLHAGDGELLVPNVKTLEAAQKDSPAAGDDFTGVRLTGESLLREADRISISPWVSGGLILGALFLAFRSEGSRKKKTVPATVPSRNADGPSL